MDLPKRKRQRLEKYDYSTPGYYFITICTYHKQHLLSEIKTGDDSGECENCLTDLGRIVQETLDSLPERFPNVRIDKRVIMPNHLHAVIALDGSDFSKSLSDIVCAFKSLAVKRCRTAGFTQPLFQNSFHDHIIRSQQDYEKIWLYIHGNPQNWNKDCFY